MVGALIGEERGQGKGVREDVGEVGEVGVVWGVMGEEWNDGAGEDERGGN